MKKYPEALALEKAVELALANLQNCTSFVAPIDVIDFITKIAKALSSEGAE